MEEDDIEVHYCERCGDEKEDENDPYCSCVTCEICDRKFVNYLQCSCCYECYEAECICCEECGGHGDGCECMGRFGHSAIPGWEQRGTVIRSAFNQLRTWQETWPEINPSVDPVMVAADFYMLEAISAGVFYPPDTKLPKADDVDVEEFFERFEIKPKSPKRKKILAAREAAIASVPGAKLSLLQARAELLLTDHVNRHIENFRAYAHMACAGEVRHHQAIGGSILSSQRDKAWAGWREVFEKVGPLAVADVTDLFMEFEEDGYGGPPWADCSDALYQFEAKELGPNEEINRRMFMDRIWTLEHNNGSFLNKIGWATYNKPKTDLNGMYVLLDAHAANPPGFDILYAHASNRVQELADNWLDIYNEMTDSDVKMVDIQSFIKVCSYCFKADGHQLMCGMPKTKKSKTDISMFNNAVAYANAVHGVLVDEDGLFHPERITEVKVIINVHGNSFQIETFNFTNWEQFSKWMTPTYPFKANNAWARQSVFINVYIGAGSSDGLEALMINVTDTDGSWLDGKKVADEGYNTSFSAHDAVMEYVGMKTKGVYVG